MGAESDSDNDAEPFYHSGITWRTVRGGGGSGSRRRRRDAGLVPVDFLGSSPVTLKGLLFALFVFFNRAQRILHKRDTFRVLTAIDDPALCVVLPLLVSAVLHTACLAPGLVQPTRHGRESVLRAILYVGLLHLLGAWIVSVVLSLYTSTAAFLAVIMAGHLCVAVRPAVRDLVPLQPLTYGVGMRVAAFAVPVLSWMLLPIFRVHSLEVIAMIYSPEALCFAFAYASQVVATLVQVCVVAFCNLLL